MNLFFFKWGTKIKMCRKKNYDRPKNNEIKMLTLHWRGGEGQGGGD